MKDQHVAEELLQRYFDGELEAASSSRVAAHIERCSECRARHARLAALQRGIRLAAEARAGEPDFEALFSTIERAVRERPAPSLAARVESRLRDAPGKPVRMYWVSTAAAGLAAAVAVLLLLQPAPRPDQRGVDGAQGPGARVAPSSEIESVDFGANAGTVFEVVLGDNVSTPVIWINDDDGEQGEE